MNHPDGTCCFCQEILNPSGAAPEGPTSTTAPQELTQGTDQRTFAEGTTEDGTHFHDCIKAASIAGLNSGSLVKLMSCLHCFHRCAT